MCFAVGRVHHHDVSVRLETLNVVDTEQANAGGRLDHEPELTTYRRTRTVVMAARSDGGAGVSLLFPQRRGWHGDLPVTQLSFSNVGVDFGSTTLFSGVTLTV